MTVIVFVEVCGQHELGVNATKSKVIVVEMEDGLYIRVRIDGETLKVVNKFVY